MAPNKGKRDRELWDIIEVNRKPDGRIDMNDVRATDGACGRDSLEDLGKLDMFVRSENEKGAHRSSPGINISDSNVTLLVLFILALLYTFLRFIAWVIY